MAKSDRQMTQDGYRPLTEGYQPGRAQPLQKGYTPTSTSTSTQQAPPPPPRGGSSAAKPPQK
jgi:hypothetical protein